MANMFRHSTPRTLCLIDEFGKGTNAQDGISLLYASLTELLRRGPACPKTLACTHYTELLEVAEFKEQRGLALWTMQVLLKDASSTASSAASSAPDGGPATARPSLASEGEEHLRDQEEVVFLYKAVRGACTDSFGTHCAVAADMPEEVIERARAISRCRLEGKPIERRARSPRPSGASHGARRPRRRDARAHRRPPQPRLYLSLSASALAPPSHCATSPLRVDVDGAQTAARERALTTLVDHFLGYDLAGHTASSFLESIDEMLLP